jgi:hypothetical protein
MGWFLYCMATHPEEQVRTCRPPFIHLSDDELIELISDLF